MNDNANKMTKVYKPKSYIAQLQKNEPPMIRKKEYCKNNNIFKWNDEDYLDGPDLRTPEEVKEHDEELLREKLHVPLQYEMDGKTYPVTAAGVLIYRYNEELKKTEFLLANYRFKLQWTDLGGKLTNTDTHYKEAAIRETVEESNELIDEISLRQRIDDCPPDKIVYIPGSKYVMYIIRATPDEATFTRDVFSPIETKYKFVRTIDWISYPQLACMIMDDKGVPDNEKVVNFRLGQKKVMDIISRIRF